MGPVCRMAVCGVVAGPLGGSVAAQTMPPSYGHTFLTIGAPGNRAANPQEAPRLFPPYSTVPRLVGAVNYEYRITRTEVTVGQWFQFVQAYKPYYTGSPNAAAFTSDWIGWNGSNYVMTPSAVNYPANMSWRMAARYTNWLHNGRASNQAAFDRHVDVHAEPRRVVQRPVGAFTGREVLDRVGG